MKEIQVFYIGGMNNGAHFTFVSNMAERAEKDSAVSEKCKAQVKALREAVAAEDENLKISAKSLVTDKIAAADRLRDHLYAGYKKAGAEHVSVDGIQDLNGSTTLAIPDGTKTIAARALYYCKSLTDVTLPASVTRIGGGAFREYTALKVLQFSGTKAQWQAIEGCDTVAVPGIQCSDGYLGVKDVPGYLKIYGTKVTGYTGELPENLVIPGGVTEIGERAFENCTSLESVEIPASVTEIGGYAFCNCTNLAEVTIPGSVTRIGGSAFYGCTSLADVTYNGTLAQWCAMDDHDDNLMDRATSVILTGESNMDLKRAETIDIPASVTEIRDYAFSGCTGLTSVTIGDGMTSIGRYAFYNCKSLESVEIPASVTEIGSSAFYNCTSLANVTYGGTEEQWASMKKGSSIFYNTKVTEITDKGGSAGRASQGLRNGFMCLRCKHINPRL